MTVCRAESGGGGGGGGGGVYESLGRVALADPAGTVPPLWLDDGVCIGLRQLSAAVLSNIRPPVS